MELTGTVVIGCGLSGLAVARELSRQGMDTIVVHGPVSDADAVREAAAEPEVPRTRGDLLRLLQGYAAGHGLDIREGSAATDLALAETAGLLPSPVRKTGKWAVRTDTGVLLADFVVLTNCSRSDLRRMERTLGAGSGPAARAALRALGVFLVGVDDGAPVSVPGMVRQAKAAGEAIAAAAAPEAPGE